MNKQSMCILLAVGMSVCAAFPCWAQTERAADSPAVVCAALADADFSGIDEAPTQIESAQLIEPKNGLLEYCQVRGYVWPQVGFELQLPTTGWNGKFIELGCGGSCGDLSQAVECPTHRGYACIASDMGHKGKVGDGLWAYNNLQAQIDFGYRGAHVAAVAGKAITEHYYGHAPKYSYFHGCSTGARQGLVEAQRFPWDFDGVIVGGVWIDDTFSTMDFIWATRALNDVDGKPLLSGADMQMVRDAVLAKCDLDDGVKDGLIGNPLACKFDPGELRCKAGVTGRCLTDGQIDALKKVYAGPTTSKGVKLTPGGPVPGSEHAWTAYSDDPTRWTLTRWTKTWFRWMTLPPAGRGWQLADFDFDRDYKRFYNGSQESLNSDTNPDLRKFKDAGGKLMAYVGWNEWSLPRKAVDYYQTVEKTMGGRQATQDFFRLFTIPGANHCTGGEGPFAVDFLSYMEAWVEQGRRPDLMIGAHVLINDDDPMWFEKLRFPLAPGTPISFTRPIYPYPLWAKYKGSGDPNRAENFEPVGP